MSLYKKSMKVKKNKTTQIPGRVLHVVDVLELAGIQSFIMNLYRVIDRDKIQFDFIVSSNDSSNRWQYKKEIISLGGRVIHLGKNKPTAMEMYRLIRRYGPFSAVHVHEHHRQALTAAFCAGVPRRICHAHFEFPKKAGYPILRLWIHGKLMLILSTVLAACSDKAGLYTYGKSSNKKYRVLNNAIHLEKFFFTQQARESLLKELNLPEESVIIGHVGRFENQKNHIFLLKIFKSFRVKNKNAHLILVGDGELKTACMELSEKYGIADYTHFLGLRADIAKILSALDLFLFPSLYEGLAIALIEAQASGLRCLAADTVTTEADAGLGLVNFFPLQYNADEWGNQINIMLRDKKDRLPIDEIRTQMRAHGFDMLYECKRVTELYLGGE